MNQKSWAGMLMAASVMVWLAWETRAVGQGGGGGGGAVGGAPEASGGGKRPRGAGAGDMQRQGGRPASGMGMSSGGGPGMMPGMGGGSMMGMGAGGGMGIGAGFDPLMQQDLALDAQIREAIEALPPAPETDGLEDEAAQKAEQAREAARHTVAELLDQQFEVRQQRREREIEEIERRVKRLRDAFDKRAAATEKIIERRLNDLFSDAEGLGWGDAGGGEAKPGFSGFSGFGIGAAGGVPGARP
ncbi:MAG: hypothetical protein ACKV0T_10455 [Planctomycetales bacterium]